MTPHIAAWIDAHTDAILIWMLVSLAALLLFTLVYAALCAVGIAS